MRRLVLAAAAALVALAACGGDDAEPPAGIEAVALNEERCLDAEEEDLPRVDLLAGALATVENHYGASPDFFEISVDRQRVSLIVAADGDAEQSFFCGADGYGAPESLGPASGATFAADDVDVDPDQIFTGILDELGDPTIIDFVIQGAPDGVLYDATVQSDAGGVLLVLLSPTGEVLAVQAT